MSVAFTLETICDYIFSSFDEIGEFKRVSVDDINRFCDSLSTTISRLGMQEPEYKYIFYPGTYDEFLDECDNKYLYSVTDGFIYLISDEYQSVKDIETRYNSDIISKSMRCAFEEVFLNNA